MADTCRTPWTTESHCKVDEFPTIHGHHSVVPVVHLRTLYFGPKSVFGKALTRDRQPRRRLLITYLGFRKIVVDVRVFRPAYRTRTGAYDRHDIRSSGLVLARVFRQQQRTDIVPYYQIMSTRRARPNHHQPSICQYLSNFFQLLASSVNSIWKCQSAGRLTARKLVAYSNSSERQ